MVTADLQACLSRLRDHADDAYEGGTWAADNTAGSESRKRNREMALAAMDDLETAIREARAAIEALP